MMLTLTPAQWKSKAREEIGDLAQNHIFELRLPLSTNAGNWLAVFNGSLSDAIAFNATAQDVRESIEGIDTVGVGNVLVTGIRKGPYYVQFQNELGGADLHGLLITQSNLNPVSNVTVADSVIGRGAVYEGEVEQLWAAMEADNVPFQVRYLVIKKEIGKKRLAILQERVDTKDRDYEEKRSQAVAQLRRTLNETAAELAQIEAQLDTAGSNAALVTKINRDVFLAGYDVRPGSCRGNEFNGRKR